MIVEGRITLDHDQNGGNLISQNATMVLEWWGLLKIDSIDPSVCCVGMIRGYIAHLIFSPSVAETSE